MTFPLEIWEHIFTYTDPITLINLKTVCKCWNEIIDKLLMQTDLWYNLCKNEIPKHYWTTLCETLSPSKLYTNFHEKNDAKFWMAMYKLWIKCENITKCDTQISCIEPELEGSFSEHITCTDISGSLLAVGTSEGFIYFYDTCYLHTRTKHIVDHMEYIKTVQFCRNETNIICISCSINNHVSFWDMNTLKEIDKTHGKLICTSYSYCYIATNNMLRVEKLREIVTYDIGSDNIIAICADNNKALFYTEGGSRVHLNVDMGNRDHTCTRIQPLNIRIRRYSTFNPGIVTCITEHGYLGFLQGEEWKVYNMFPILHGTPTAVLIYAHILILGLDSGNVHIYYIDDFRSINFHSISSKKLTLDTSAVISLNIMVNVAEYLIVAYSKKIHTVKFI
ncbi:unnamed protein product [Xylocopa violacea]|uniref:F-box domain-containing protein n=2 Tax=Xylocopa violacea TaxID=135666 RepID=A0ABP1PFX0_XYLVO